MLVVQQNSLLLEVMWFSSVNCTLFSFGVLSLFVLSVPSVEESVGGQLGL